MMMSSARSEDSRFGRNEPPPGIERGSAAASRRESGSDAVRVAAVGVDGCSDDNDAAAGAAAGSPAASESIAAAVATASIDASSSMFRCRGATQL